MIAYADAISEGSKIELKTNENQAKSMKFEKNLEQNKYIKKYVGINLNKLIDFNTQGLISSDGDRTAEIREKCLTTNSCIKLIKTFAEQKLIKANRIKDIQNDPVVTYAAEVMTMQKEEELRIVES